jgi:hypothetical protein
MRQNGNTLIGIVIGVVIVLLVGAAYFLGTQKNFFKTPVATNMPVMTNVATSTPVVQSTNNPSSDPTLSWKTYSDTHFSFKYPSNWNTKLLSDQSQDVIVTPNQIPQGGVDGGKWETIVVSLDPGAENEYTSNDEKDVKSKAVTVNGVSATEYTKTFKIDEPGINKGDVIVDTVLTVNGKKYVVELLDPKYVEIYHQLLSTLTIK